MCSAPKQIEYWAELGKIVETIISIDDAYAVLQGLKKLKVESTESAKVNPDTVFNSIEKSRKSGNLSLEVTSSPYYYEASIKYPGKLDRVEAATGKRETGIFRSGKFVKQK